MGGSLPRVSMQAGGKPWFPARPDVCFNLSHSGPYALCAVSDEKIGADIETIRPRRALLQCKALSEPERQWLHARGGRWEDFYTLWTLKEARVKQSGTGLDRPPRAIAVPLLSPGETALFQGLRFTAYGGPGWRAALCAPTGTAPLQWF